MNLSKLFNSNSADNKQESYKYIANTLIDVYQKDRKKVFSFTSSSMSQKAGLEVVKKISNQISEKGLNSLIIQAWISDKKDITEVSDIKEKSLLTFNDLTPSELKKIIVEEQDDYDFILVLIPSVILKADALEYTKFCDKNILIEKYMYCYYSSYEETLLRLKNAGVKPYGVITVV